MNEIIMNTINEENYLTTIMDRLKRKRYKVLQNITYDNLTFKYVAKRTKWESERYGFCTTTFIFYRNTTLNIASIQNFSAKAFNYSKRIGWPLLKGFAYGILCFPVAIVDSIDNKTIEFIQKTEPPRHWSGVEKIVVYNLENGSLYYCEATFKLGSWYYDWDRLIIREFYLLSPPRERIKVRGRVKHPT